MGDPILPDDLYNNLNSMISTYNKQRSSIGDTATLNAEHLSTLRSNLADAERTLRTAPEKLLTAQRALASSDDAYSRTFKKQVKTAGNAAVERLKTEFETSYDTILDLIDYYDTQQAFKGYVGDLESNYKENIQKTQSSIDDMRGDRNIDNRLSKFYTNQRSVADWALSYFKVIYWTLFLVQLFATAYAVVKKKVSGKTIAYLAIGLVLYLAIPMWSYIVSGAKPVAKVLSLFPTP